MVTCQSKATCLFVLFFSLSLNGTIISKNEHAVLKINLTYGYYGLTGKLVGGVTMQ